MGTVQGFHGWLSQLRAYPPEQLIQPELKHHRQQQDRKLREEQDLAAGAVLSAVVEAGEGDAKPQEGDLVYIHVGISNDEDDLLWSTRAEEGGSGQAFAFLLEKGRRVPRAWEVAVKGMTKGQKSALKVRPSYGFHHPDCKMKAPPGVPSNQRLNFLITLVQWYSADQVRCAGGHEDVYKRVLEQANSWETARAPFEVTFHTTIRALAYDGIQQTGQVLFSTQADIQPKGSAKREAGPITVDLGQGALPAGLEEAVSQLSRGEKALFIMPAEALSPPQGAGSGSSSAAVALPALPSKALQAEVELQLLSFVQVRDVTGTGEVTKKRVTEGTGEFPIDCPLNDTTVRAHYRVRVTKAGTPGPWLFDTRKQRLQQAAEGSNRGQQQEQASDGELPPLEFDTGCGEAPEGVELAMKLMVPGEVALVGVRGGTQYGYRDRDDTPPGLSPDDSLEFEVELVSFEREGHWQVMPMPERFELAERVKAKANALVKAGKHRFARARYDRMLRLMESTRDFETQEEVDRMEALKVAMLSNLALCAMALNEPAAAISYCDKALQYNDTVAKLWFRRGKALCQKGDYEEAVLDLRKAAELDTSVAAEVDREIAAVKQRAKQAEQKQKSQFKNFFDRT